MSASLRAIGPVMLVGAGKMGLPLAAQFASPRYFHQYVIAVSANSDNETVQEALRAGADSFVSKPFSYDCFTEAMQNRPQTRV